MAEQIAFKDIAFVRNGGLEIQAVTALCVTCRHERALSFAEVIGGVAMRCGTCGSRAVTRVDEVQSHSIEAFADSLRRSEWHRAYAVPALAVATRAEDGVAAAAPGSGPSAGASSLGRTVA